MPRSVTALFATEAEAETGADRLSGIGIPRSKVTIVDQSEEAAEAQKPGFFDHLTDLLLSEDTQTSSNASRTGFLLTAEVDADQVDRAASLLETGAIMSGGAGAELREQVFEFSETVEELVIGKEAIVREEVVLKKEVEERIEHVEGTVRHTEVEIERIPPEPIRFGGREDVLRESGVKGTR